MNTKEIKKTVGKAATNLKDAAVATEETLVEATQDAVTCVREKSSEAFHSAEAKTKEFCRQTEKVVCDAKDKLIETGQTVVEKTTEAANETAKKASKLYHSMTD